MLRPPAYVSMGPAAPMSRRHALQLVALSAASLCAARPAHALKPGKPSKDKLLNSLRDEKTPEEIEEEKQRKAEERRQRLERQQQLQAEAERRKAGLDQDPTADTEIESNLRGQYYFPTARKRYLPRLKLAWESLDDVQTAASSREWTAVSDLSTGVLTDAVLPMKLYASSLAGGGLNISSKFIEKMTRQATLYEDAVKKMSKAIKKKDSTVAVSTVSDMRSAITEYRKLGKLEDDNFGIGEINTDMRVGSGFSNNNSALYYRNKSVKATASAPAEELTPAIPSPQEEPSREQPEAS